MSQLDIIKIGLISTSDRAHKGIYQDEGIPALKKMPGFGEQMRQISLNYVPTAILSRQTAGIRGKCLIVNLPGQPKAIAETLEGVRDEHQQIKIHGLFSAIPYCVELISGAMIYTDEKVCKAFRPKKK